MPVRLILFVTAVLACAAPAQLSGTFTIDPLVPMGPGNYTSLNAASAALAAQGVSGPCVFEIFGDATTPYVESAPWVPGINLGGNTACWVLSSWPGTSATNTVTFRAAAGQSPVLDANGQACVVYWNGADYTTIEGLELRGAQYDAVCMYTPSTNPTGTATGTNTAVGNTITRCHIHDCGAVGVLFYANSGTLNDTTISNNFLHDLVTSNARGGFSGFVRDGYLAGRRDSGTRIINNTLLVNTLGTNANSPVAAIVERHDGSPSRTGITRLEGNVILKTTSFGLAYRFYASATAPLPLPFDRNCLRDTGGGASFGELLGVVYPDVTAWILTSGVDANSLDADPQLVSLAPPDLHLSPGSPCIGAMPLVPGIAVDIDGDPRPGPLADIGADEVGPGCTPPEYETNDDASALALDGVQGTACSAAVTITPVSTSGVATLSSTNVGLAWEMGIAVAPLRLATSGALQTANGQILNLDVFAPVLTYVNGGPSPSFQNPFPFNLTLPYTAPPAPAILCTQAVNFDPTHADGFALSQGCQLNVQ